MRLPSTPKAIALALLAALASACSTQLPVETSYLVLASSSVQQDAAWDSIAHDLCRRHGAELLYFNEHPEDCEEQLRQAAPRYVAIVDMPQNISDRYVMRLNRLSRRMDSDIYADWLWGIVTGYDAESAARMVSNSEEPLVVHDCVSDIMELQSAKWFDHYAWVDDHVKGKAGEKLSPDDTVRTYMFPFDQELEVLSRYIEDLSPDLIVTATHANYSLLTVPFMPAEQCMFVSDSGVIWKNYGREKTEPVRFSGKRNVYFPVGNCLIGAINNNPNSMPPAWIKSANSAAMAGYVVPTWYGRNGWGALKYWLTTPGRYTLPEAVFLNQQDMMAQMDRWNGAFSTIDYPFGEADSVSQTDYTDAEFDIAAKRIRAVGVDSVTNDMLGFLYDRDVLVYYGDPLWNVRLQEIAEENDYTVSQVRHGKTVTITIKTKENFSLERMKGDHFKEEHVLDLPFSVFFNQRLKNPRLADGQTWDAALDENFLLLYNPDLKPGQTYTVEIVTD